VKAKTKAKIQIGTGLFAAVIVGVGVTTTAVTVKGHPLDVGDLILLGLLVGYILAVIMKKRALSRVIVFLWCAAWIVPFVVDIVIRSTPDMCNHLFAVLLVWPYFVSQQFFFGRPYFASGMHAVAFGGSCTLLIGLLLWIGTNGINRPVKIENESDKKSLSEQKDTEE
jgi:hypothetical protein